MPMEEALVARLKAAAGVGGVVSWFDRPRASALPASTLTEIGTPREWTHGGPSGTQRARIQIDSWGATGPETVARGRAVLAEMEQERVVGGIRFHPAMLESKMTDGPEDMTDGGKVYRSMQDFAFYFEAA